MTTQIDPTKPCHARSPDYEAEIWKISDNEIWGRYRRKKGLRTWSPCTWYLDGRFLLKEHDDIDLIQEPEEEVIVWENIKVLHMNLLDHNHKFVEFNKLITLTIKTKEDKVTITGETE
jgi:hypothetical protein